MIQVLAINICTVLTKQFVEFMRVCELNSISFPSTVFTSLRICVILSSERKAKANSIALPQHASSETKAVKRMVQTLQ